MKERRGRMMQGRIHNAGCGMPSLFAGEEGFTLAELLVVVGILIVFLVGVAGMLQAGAGNSTSQYALTRIEEDAAKVIDVMTRQIRVATAIDYQSTRNTLIFSGDLEGDGVTRRMVFTASGGRLWKGPSPDALEIWVEGVSSLAFAYYRYNPDTKTIVAVTPQTSGWNTSVERIDITLVFSRRAGGVDISRTFTTTVRLRNDI